MAGHLTTLLEMKTTSHMSQQWKKTVQNQDTIYQLNTKRLLSMKKIIKEVDEKKGIVQVTIADERWYLKSEENKKTGIPEWKSVPSVTWVTQSYPKGIQYFKWLADKGWDEAEAIKVAAGDKGSKVHKAIEDVLQGIEVRIDSKYINNSTGQEEELTLEECDCILSFKSWFDEVKPEVITWETSVFSDKHNYAGTIDFVCRIDNQFWIVDFKTSQYIWPSHELQVSAYKEAITNGENEVPKYQKGEDIKLAILQVGYRKNKAGYKFTEIEDQFDLFKAAQLIWKKEHEGEQPTKKDYPIILSPKLEVKEIITDEK